MTNQSHSTLAESGSESRDSNPYLASLGERARAARSRRGMTRKALSQAAGVSERHLANLESGRGNVSVLVLKEVAAALDCPIAELVGDFTTGSPEWLLIRSLLQSADAQTLHRARLAITELTANAGSEETQGVCIALIGLRGAGKSTLGQMLAQQLDIEFIEISREIEQLAGCSIAEIQDLYGPSAYRRYEQQALKQALETSASAVIATPGGVVADPVNFSLLLDRCYCVWLQANPADHMQRVIEQGDFRPMAGNSEAMDDLKRILEAREPYYARAEASLDTSRQSLEATLGQLSELAVAALQPTKPE